MRLTRLAIDGDAVVDLHPRLTLVRGLDDDARQRFVDAIGGLADGATRGVTGWVEVDGARRDLGASVFDDPSLPADLRLVVRAGELPGSDPALHRVSTERADLGFERDRLLERLESARARVREATEECGRTLRDWQVVHGGLPEVGDDGAVLLDPAEEPEDDEPDADAEQEEELVDPRAEIQVRIDEIDRALLPLDPVGPDEVLAALEAAVPAEPDPADEIDEIDEIDEVEVFDPLTSSGDDLFASDPFAERAFADPVFPEPETPADPSGVPFEEHPDPVVVAGRLRVAEARRALAAEEASQRSGLARSELIEALEAAHTEVVEAHHRDRFGRSRSKVDAARLTEQELLDQLGFPSYTAYVLSAGAVRSGDGPEGLIEAQVALEAAEAELERIVAGRSAASLTADSDDEEPEAAPLAMAPSASADLRIALAEVGLVLDDVDTDDATLVHLARSWLQEQETAEERREALLAERAELVEQLAALPGPAEVEVVEELSEVAALARAEAELLAAEAEVSGVTTRLEEIAEATKVLVEAEAHAEAEAEEAEEPVEVSTEQRVDDVTWYLSTRLAALRTVGDGLTLPILLDDPFVDFDADDAIDLLGSVEPFGGAVQIVLLTDDPALIRWSEALGTERAWVVGAEV